MGRIPMQMDRDTYRQECRMEDYVSDKRMAYVYMPAAILQTGAHTHE